MPKLGLGLGLPTTRVSAAFDPDALAYFTAAGISDATAKTQINDFVKGLKGLNLWNTSVFWPMRLTQNASSGTTLYSLGGLGIHNGTFSGTTLPIRNADGINFLTGDVNSRIAVSTLSLAPPMSLYGCWSVSTSTNSFEVLASSLGAGGYGLNFGKNSADSASPFSMRLGAYPSNLASTTEVSGGVKLFLSGYQNGASSSIVVNGSANSGTVGGTGFAGGANIGNGAGTGGGANKNYEISFFMVSSSALNDASVRALYKSTLGSGLGLP